MSLTLLILSLLLAVASRPEVVRADSFGNGVNQFEIEFVTIGDPGNPADSTGSPDPAGSVGYSYRMGIYEISEDMVNKAKLLSEASGSPLSMATSNRGPNRPVTSITWLNIARFVNWLNTSKGYTPAYKFDVNGSFQLWEPSDVGYDESNRYRNRLAAYFLPSVDEWHKAAYYDPNAEVYYDFPTASNSVPDGIDFAGDLDFEAVFHDGGSNRNPNNITNVGLLSPYGTAGQGGNAWEFLETHADLENDSTTGERVVRGMGWTGSGFLPSAMSSNFYLTSASDVRYSDAGFRVASIIPEPTTCTLALAALCLVVGRRRR